MAHRSSLNDNNPMRIKQKDSLSHKGAPSDFGSIVDTQKQKTAVANVFFD